ncbi:GAF domain-containing protein [Nostoc sp. LEGE 06077]|uniref:GAF domain-containing protein n=1 Tax=Nostoc sp. LEGE 06077 TaxID=915325 RepID=UPI001882B4D0|nr:GAF domain-containing protein [Nostoc sp. LEGE 06077]MBE9210795.1 GAF domain-containing protein [Nostoc sp. LEGE 06077]
MTNLVLPKAVQDILVTYSEPDHIFTAILPIIGEVLQCDRCFLYLRNPHTKMGKVGYCWRRNENIPDVREPEWKLELESLPQEDPLFAAALRTAPSIYVEDVEIASPEVLNKNYERENFGHRALIHAHLCQDNQLWGILQPCIFGQPRVWSDSDHAFISQMEDKLTPLVVAYVKKSTASPANN